MNSANKNKWNVLKRKTNKTKSTSNIYSMKILVDRQRKGAQRLSIDAKLTRIVTFWK